MEQTPEIIEVVKEVVLEPTLLGAFWITIISLVGEIVGTFPTSIVFPGQLLLFDGEITFSILTQFFFLVALPIGFGTALGALLHYVIAYFGGKPAIEKTKKYTGVSWERVESWETKFFKRWYDEAIFFALRATPFIPTVPLNLLAGVLRMKPERYFILTLLGITVRMSIMIAIFAFGGGAVLEDILNL